VLGIFKTHATIEHAEFFSGCPFFPPLSVDHLQYILSPYHFTKCITKPP